MKRRMNTVSKPSAKNQHTERKIENAQQSLSSAKEAKTVEVNWDYLVKVLSTLMLVSQTMLMHKYKLVTAENALKQIDILLDSLVKHS